MSSNKFSNNQYIFPLIILLASLGFWSYIINKVNVTNPTLSEDQPSLSNGEEQQVESQISIPEKKGTLVIESKSSIEENKDKPSEILSLNTVNVSTSRVEEKIVNTTSTKVDKDIIVNNTEALIKQEPEALLPNPEVALSVSIKEQLENQPKIDNHQVVNRVSNEKEKKLSKQYQAENSFKPLTPTLSFDSPDPKNAKIQQQDNIETLVTKPSVITPNNNFVEKKKDKQITNPSVAKTQMEAIMANLKKDEEEKKANQIDIKQQESANIKTHVVTDLQERIQSLTTKLIEEKGKVGITQDKNTKYVEALKNQDSEVNLTKQDKDEVDYYNRIQLDQANKQNTLQDKIYRLTSDSKSTQYINSLNVESLVRINQVRSIELKKGESIWKIAVRAYGDGNKYLKILKANPQITVENAKFLQPGTFIRVPL